MTVKNDNKDFKRIKSSGEIVTKDNINDYLPKLDEAEASNLLSNLQEMQAQVNSGTTTWNEYFDVFKEKNQGYLVDFVQKTDLQKASTEDLIKANEAARQSALDYNKALKQQTLGARAAVVGLDIAKAALNSLAYAGIAAAITAMANAIITKITEIVNAYADGVKKIKDLTDEVKSLESEQSSLNDELKESKERLYELQQIKMPTLFEEGEIENLKEYNKQLEAQIRLKELELELKKKEANETAQETFKNSQFDYNSIDDFTNEDFQWWEHILNTTSHGWYQRGRNALQNVTNWFEGNTWKQQEDYLAQAEKALEDFENREDAAKRYKEVYSKIDEYRNIVNSGQKATLEDIQRIFGEDVLDRFNLPFENFIERIDHLLTNESAKEFLDQFDEAFDKSKEKLDEYINNLTTRLSDWRIELAGLDPNDQNNTERINQLKVIAYETKVLAQIKKPLDEARAHVNTFEDTVEVNL